LSYSEGCEFSMTQEIKFLTEHIPEPGEVYEILSGIQWIRMPLPFRLNHINLWMIEEENGWVLIDTGINDNRTKSLWREIFVRTLNGKPLSRLICTHAHPDHIGLGGWIHDKYGAALLITRGEWNFGRLFSTGNMKNRDSYREYFLRIGCSEADVENYGAHIMTADQLYCDVPQQFDRICDGSTITISGQIWEVIIGLGHSQEHACLYCSELGILIAGDQVLPKITPTIMVHPYEPEANPLADFLESNEKLRMLPDTVKVLSSHNRPFIGLHARLDQYIEHHAERLEVVVNACKNTLSGIEVSKILFPQDLDIHGKYFAVGETMAHIRYLENNGSLFRSDDSKGVERYSSF
jgi:glyoxylase-like metal-dependent hydrolase (beta-lactamase superfamily II)